ncbi:MAG: hypothetical protein P0Y53_13210 [Candidatus Pseudobacter hemicellulosilyticus]|uniref:Uncharacterized protein n=1 Tax=Candidatus Pseudobacter hemicellulosilyticus TaxID=3121375 RepID=A0AAJ5WLS5_9BACT|nr:MAG: hypothetical protein P0Y53_13210 [Pseudobacter sp.]
MEQSSTDSLFDLQVDHETGEYLRETGKWSRFIGISYIVCCALGLVVLLVLLLVLYVFRAVDLETALEAYPTLAGREATLIIPFMLGIAGCGILTVAGIQLVRFARNCKYAVQQQDQAAFNASLRNLRTFLLLFGIVIILSVVASLLQMAVAI